MAFADNVIAFNKSLGRGLKVSGSISVLNPYANPTTRKLSEDFYKKFYNDSNPRIFILGINPGRFGAGVTGVPFTDPVNLKEFCGVKNSLDTRHELSSIFVYDFINAFGGTKRFYKDFFISAVCPLGFTKEGKNINYYDDRTLQQEVEPFIIRKMKLQLNFPARPEIAIVLGEGKNYKYFKKLNERFGFFEELVALPHPRFILQYRRKMVDDYRELYLKELKASIKKVS